MNVTDRFDGAKAWANLSVEMQTAIGATALELVCAWNAQEQGFGDDCHALSRAADHADAALIEHLQGLFDQAVFSADLEIGDQARLPSFIGPICRECGCSQNDACFPSCSWVEPDLCSACISKVPA